MDEAKRFLDAAFIRNLGILTPDEQDTLLRARVAVPGLGGVGGLHCSALARLGVGHFVLADNDRFELANTNRQYGAVRRHMGRAKLEAMSAEISQINPLATVRGFERGLEPENIDAFISQADLVMDGLDFGAFAIRRTLFTRARELGRPVITAAPLGFTAALLVFTPDSMSFDHYFDIHDGLSERECLLRFAVGLAPAGLHLGQIDPGRVRIGQGKGPSLGLACLLCAALAGTEAVRLLTGRTGSRPAPWSLQVDMLGGRTRWSRPGKGNASPVQRIKLWYVRNVVLGGEAGFERAPVTPPEAPAEGSRLSSDSLTWLARAASQAPSGDNCQPWSFAKRQGKLQVFLDPSADHSFFNFRQLASVIACGAAVQNAMLAATELGWLASASLLPDPGQERLMAELTFEPGAAFADPLADAVWSRCTNRRLSVRRPVEPASRQRLEEAAAPLELRLLHDPREMKRLAGALYHADRIRVEREDLHRHFVSMTRFDPSDGRGYDDGLPLKNLHAGLAGEAFLRLTRPWPVMRAANLLGLGRLVAMHSRSSMLSSPLAGLVLAPSADAEGFLKGGMAMQRVWLSAERLGLALQPMTAVTLFWLRWRLEGPSAFSRAHRELLKASVWPVFEALFPGLGQDTWPLMLFRVGHAGPVRFGTPRRLEKLA